MNLITGTATVRRLAIPAAFLLTLAGLAAALWTTGPAQAQDAAPAVDNLHCIVRTDVVGFFWEGPAWSGGEASSYDYQLTLPNGSAEGGRLHESIKSVIRWGAYASGQAARISVTANHETSGGSTVAGAAAELTCYVGGARPLTITPNSATRQYGGTDDLSHTVSGLVDGDAPGDVISGSLSRAAGDDAGSYAINLGTLAIAPDYTEKYALPAGPAVATYVITPKPATYTGTAPSRAYDGTTTLSGALSGGFAAGDILAGDTVTARGGTYAQSDAATGIAVSGVSAGGADASNYTVTFSVSGDITPRAVTAISGARVNSRPADGTTDATFDTGGVRVAGVLPGELADFQAGGLAVSGSFPSASAGSHDVSVTYSLQDHGSFKAANYALSASAATDTLRGDLQTASAQSAVGCEVEAGDDYDDDDDGLIDVCNLAQLSAIRYDLDGDGSASGSTIAGAGDAYKAAFPGIVANGAGCPQSGCQGYELTRSLDFDTNGNGKADANDAGDYYGDNGVGWLPIGRYAAVFDGNGNTISHLYIGLQRPKIGVRGGLFYVLGETGVIRNVALENVLVDGNGHQAGALVGDNHGTVSNAGMSGTVSGWYKIGGLVGQNNRSGTITDSYSSGEVSSARGRTGGLVGHNYGRVARSWSTADVSLGTATAYEAWPAEHLNTQPYAFGGLVGYNASFSEIKASIVASYATGRVKGNVRRAGGLAGSNAGDIFASYATGDVSGDGLVGGLAGRNVGLISASYTLGAVSGNELVGGLVGRHDNPRRNSHRCIGCDIPNVRPGHADRSGVTASYWNRQAAGQTATVAMHLDNWQSYLARDTQRTTAELQQPTGYAGIYAYWDNLRDQSGDSYAWDFGASLDFPVLRDTGPSVAAQRALLPDPPTSTEPVQTPATAPPAGKRDYDRDDDGLIEVWNLAQLHAIRWDSAGSGEYGWQRGGRINTARDAYQLAFPRAMRGMGCPLDRCIGYELMTDLDFDTNGNGKADSGDHYWNGEHFPDDSAFCIDWYKEHPNPRAREIPGFCDIAWGNQGEGWRPIARIMAEGWHGVFEGNGHAIRNLYINALDSPSNYHTEVLEEFCIPGLRCDGWGDTSTRFEGLFEYIYISGVVRNLRLENVNVSGKKSVGALAGSNRGIVSNVHVTGAVSGIDHVGGLAGDAEADSFITGSSARAGVVGRKAGSHDAGGLVGLNHGEIQASYVQGAVSGWANNTGGLVGRNAEGGSIKASYATGPVSSAGSRAGGLVGDNVGSITASYSTGSASADGGDAGGLAGRHRTGTVTAAYWDTQASGQSSSAAGTGKTTSELQQPTGYAGIYAGWNPDLTADGNSDSPWDFGGASQYPVLRYGGLSTAAQRAPFTARALNLPHVGGGQQPQAPANQRPTASGSLSDVTVASGGGTQTVSLTGLFSDPDNDSLTITASALTITATPPPNHDGVSYIEVVTVSVSSDQSTLTLTGQTPGTATVTVAASDGKGGAALVEFVATVQVAEPEPQPLTPPDEEESQPQQAATQTLMERCASHLPANAISVAEVTGWRDAHSHDASHVLRWNRVLEALGEDTGTGATPLTMAESKANELRFMRTRWSRVTATLEGISVCIAAQQQQDPDNNTPTVSAAIADATIVNASGTSQVSLSGVFSDADNDGLTITAASSDEDVATVSVAADYSSLTVTAKARGTATITVTANDGNGGKVDDTFSIRVKAAPIVASAITDLSGLEEGESQDISLSGVFSDADGDALTVTAASSNQSVATVSVASDQSKLTVAGVAEGTATVTVTAQDSDGNTVSDAFAVSVTAPPQQEQQSATGAPAVDNLHCIVRTDVVGFFWAEPEWSGGEVSSYDYRLTLPDGRSEGGNLRDLTSVIRWGEYQTGQTARFSITTNYETPDGSTVAGAEATLTCTVG